MEIIENSSALHFGEPAPSHCWILPWKKINLHSFDQISLKNAEEEEDENTLDISLIGPEYPVCFSASVINDADYV